MRAMNRRHVLMGLLASLAAPNLLRAELPVSQFNNIAELALAAVDGAALQGDVAYVVIDLASGAVLAERQPDASFPPASTLKSVTALYAQARLGPDHRFTTRVIRDGDRLVLMGGGDPELDSDALAELAKATVAAHQASGATVPTRLEVWGGALPQIARISSAQADHLPYNPTISGMILNFNRVHLGWSKADSGYRMSLQARGSRQSPPAYTVAITAADRGSPLFTYDGEGKRENWTMAGRAMGQSGSRWLPVRRPELYAGDVFQTLCRAEGLALPAPGVATDTPIGVELARRDSRPLHRILTDMMEYSNNLTAEVVGLVASGQGDLRSSAKAMEDWLRGQGVSGGFTFADHSGLSPQSRITARMMANLMAQQGLQQGLRGMMRHIRLRNAKGKEIDSPIRVEAKTGTLNFASNLAGYVQNGSDGDMLGFAILTLDEARRSASEGQELPDGVITWTKRSKALQQALIESWVGPAQMVAELGQAGSGAVGSRRPLPRPVSARVAP